MWINEFHYDNIGTNENEFIEIVVEDGADLSLIQVTRLDRDGTVENPDATQITEQINIEYDDPIDTGERLALISDDPNDPASASDPTLVAFEIQAIPTLSQWSILILSLVIWIFGICQIKTTISTRKQLA